MQRTAAVICLIWISTGGGGGTGPIEKRMEAQGMDPHKNSFWRLAGVGGTEAARACGEDKGQVYTVTAYCSCRVCCGRFADGVTASGHKIKKGSGEKFCAMDKAIPFGTIVDIEGYGQAVPVLDRGKAIGPGRIDVYFDRHEEAAEWGIKKLEVRIQKSDVRCQKQRATADYAD